MFKKLYKVRCPVIAYTAYRHMLWIADGPKPNKSKLNTIKVRHATSELVKSFFPIMCRIVNYRSACCVSHSNLILLYLNS